MLSHCYKIYGSILTNKIQKLIEAIFSEKQHALCCKRLTTYLTFTMTLEKHWEYGNDMVLAFIKFKKAYNIIKTEKIWSR
jgi:hypothetical protein